MKRLSKESGSTLMTRTTYESMQKKLKGFEDELEKVVKGRGDAPDHAGQWHDVWGLEEADRQQRLFASRVLELRGKLTDVKIIEPRQDSDAIEIGNTVTLCLGDQTEEFTVLSPEDFNYGHIPGCLPFNSPLGHTILHQKQGACLTYQTENNGEIQKHAVEILAIKPGNFR